MSARAIEECGRRTSCRVRARCAVVFGALGFGGVLVGTVAVGAGPSIDAVGEPIPEIETSDRTGWAVSASSDGSRIAVASPGPTSPCGLGRVRVFDWSASGWMQVGQTIEGGTAGPTSSLPPDSPPDIEIGGCEEFGDSVALSGDGSRLAVGAAGSAEYSPNAYVRVFELRNDTWARLGDVIDESAVIGEDDVGRPLALSDRGDRIAVGAPTVDGLRGRVRVFDWDGTTWTQVGGDLHDREDPALQRFGGSVVLSADGNRVAVGRPSAGSIDGVPYAGAVHVFDWDGGIWQQAGSPIDGSTAGSNETGGDSLGSALGMSADGDRLAASSPGRYVRVVEWTGAEWIPLGSDVTFEPDPEDPAQYVQPAANFGRSIALSSGGDRLAVGVPGWGCDHFCGVADVFDWDGTAWVYSGGVGGGQESHFGRSVAIGADGARLVVGAPGGAAPGYARVFAVGGATFPPAPEPTITGPADVTLPPTGGGAGERAMLAASCLLLLGAAIAVAARRPRSA